MVIYLLEVNKENASKYTNLLFISFKLACIIQVSGTVVLFPFSNCRNDIIPLLVACHWLAPPCKLCSSILCICMCVCVTVSSRSVVFFFQYVINMYNLLICIRFMSVRRLTKYMIVYIEYIVSVIYNLHSFHNNRPKIFHKSSSYLH